MKTCTKCKLSKEFSSFSPRGNGKFASRCKVCLAKIRKDNYDKKIIYHENNVKTCLTCSEVKPISDFYRNYNCSSNYRNECKACNYLRVQIRKDELKKFLIELKSVPCKDCENIYPYYVMDFDHRDGSDKEYNLSEMRFFSKEKILEEASKCDVVCSNCHRERTQQRLLNNKSCHSSVG